MAVVTQEDRDAIVEHDDQCWTDGLRQLAEIIRESREADWLAVSHVLDDCAANIDRLHAKLVAKEAELASERAKVERLRAFVADVAGQWLPHEPEPFDDFDPCLEDGYRLIVERARATLAETQP